MIQPPLLRLLRALPLPVDVERGWTDRDFGFVPDSVDFWFSSRVAGPHMVFGQPENPGSIVQSRVVPGTGHGRLRSSGKQSFGLGALLSKRAPVSRASLRSYGAGASCSHRPVRRPARVFYRNHGGVGRHFTHSTAISIRSFFGADIRRQFVVVVSFGGVIVSDFPRRRFSEL